MCLADLPGFEERRHLADALEALVELWRGRRAGSGTDPGPLVGRCDRYLESRAGAAAEQAVAGELLAQVRTWWEEARSAGPPEDLEDRLLAGIHLAGRLVAPQAAKLRLAMALVLQWKETDAGARGELQTRIDSALEPEGADHE